ncbi:Mec-6 [Aphelenchoides bicaudatus]|nr:Mec-6 [Aphelenchoides bicaudatus]
MWSLASAPVKFIAIESFRRLPFILLFTVVSAIVIRTALLLDSNKHVFNHKPGRCRLHEELADGGAAYFENVEPLRYLFASDGFKRMTNSTYNAGVYFTEYPKSNAQKQPKQQFKQSAAEKPQQDEAFIKAMGKLKFHRLSISGSDELLKDFTPMGIGSYVEGSISQKKFRLYLYIINARSQQPNRVEVFLFKPKEQRLLHQFTVEDPSFTSLSDIVVFGAGRFLVSNVFRWSNRWLQFIEFITQREYGSLLMYDGKKVVSLASAQTPNGLFWDQKSRRLYVALTNAETIKIFNVRQDMALVEQTQINLMSGPDQLYFQASTNEIWLTSHPITHQLLNVVFSGFQAPSASHVLRVRFQGNNMDSWVITEPLANNGTMLSTASAIALIDDYLLVGSRLAKTISCRLNDPLYA